jgi:glycosyltransferase involved in cell wall biosynthesis
MVVHSYYDEDPRLRRQAERLVAEGRQVDVFGLRREEDEPRGIVEGVSVTRIDVQRHQGAGIGTYVGEYLSFLVRATLALALAHRRRRYGLVQVASVPDFLVFATLPLKALGVPVVLDLHEAMGEMFASRFPRLNNPVMQRLIEAQERISASVANRVINVNEAMSARTRRIGVPEAKLAIVPNAPVLARFDATKHPTRAFREDGRLKVIYTGALTPIYELDVVLDAIADVARSRPDLDVRFDIYGRGDQEDALREQASRLGIGERVTFHGRVPFEAVPPAVAASDIGVAPTRRDDYTDSTISTKNFEYGAMRKPVIASWLPLVASTFGDGTVVTYPSGDATALAAAIIRLADDPAELGWEREGERYVALIDELALGPARS